MQTPRSAYAAALCCVLTIGLALMAANPAAAAWNKPWTSESRALVIDAYEFNPIDWQALTADKRIAGFINKASDGMPPEWNCNGKSGDDKLLCKNRWWKYSVTKELYMTRRAMAKTLGLKWGAYHLARPGNPRAQADHFLDFAEPEADDLIAIDIEDNTDEWMSLADAEIFANQIFVRTGRYPVLYTNGSTAKWISDYKTTYPLLARLPLWYARYRDDITGMFPETTWPSYALWQFSSMQNCSEKQCPYRVKGAKSDIDVNVSTLDVAGLKAAWPFNELVTPLDQPQTPALVAEAKETAGRALTQVAPGEASNMLLAAYGPTGGRSSRVDPLELLTETALAERRGPAMSATPPSLTGPAPKGEDGTRVIQPGKPAKLASLSPFASLSDEMRDVAAIVPATAESVPVRPAAKSPIFGAADKSRFRQWLEASDAKEQQAALAMPAYVMSQTPRDTKGRGARPSAGLRKAAFGPIGAGQRIADAFAATR